MSKVINIKLGGYSFDWVSEEMLFNLLFISVNLLVMGLVATTLIDWYLDWTPNITVKFFESAKNIRQIISLLVKIPYIVSCVLALLPPITTLFNSDDKMKNVFNFSNDFFLKSFFMFVLFLITLLGIKTRTLLGLIFFAIVQIYLSVLILLDYYDKRLIK